MSSWSAVGLPLALLRGNVNGTLAWYKVIHKGYYRDVFGVRVGDVVLPLDVSPFKETIMKSIENYIDAFYMIECSGSEYEYQNYLTVGNFDIVSSECGYLDDLIALVNVLSDVISFCGLCNEVKEFMNYSRFYPVEVKNDFFVRLGSSVSVDVLKVNGGSLVNVEIDYPSLGVIYRGIWEASRHDCGDNVLLCPVIQLAREIVEKYNIEMPDLPVIRF